MSRTTSYWCYRCTRIVRLTSQHTITVTVTCPYCDGEFIEAVSSPPRSTTDRSERNRSDRSPFNPVVVLRGGDDHSTAGDRGFELYYHEGVGTGLQPLPPTISEFLMESGFDRLLDQLSQIDLNGLGHADHPPASKVAVESMPVIEISDVHVTTDLHCAVCKEAFVIGGEGREMPCNHIYHSDCILPWLSIRNSCPVCRHEVAADSMNEYNQQNHEDESAPVGLTIWRLPGGGFAVGRFSGGRRALNSDRELPVVYTEMDGGFNNGFGTPRRVVWESGRDRRNGGGGFGRAFRNMFSFFRRRSGSGSNYDGESMNRSRSVSSLVFGRMTSRRNRTWNLDEQNGLSRW